MKNQMKKTQWLFEQPNNIYKAIRNIISIANNYNVFINKINNRVSTYVTFVLKKLKTIVEILNL